MSSLGSRVSHALLFNSIPFSHTNIHSLVSLLSPIHTSERALNMYTYICTIINITIVIIIITITIKIAIVIVVVMVVIVIVFVIIISWLSSSSFHHYHIIIIKFVLSQWPLPSSLSLSSLTSLLLFLLHQKSNENKNSLTPVVPNMFGVNSSSRWCLEPLVSCRVPGMPSQLRHMSLQY